MPRRLLFAAALPLVALAGIELGSAVLLALVEPATGSLGPVAPDPRGREPRAEGRWLDPTSVLHPYLGYVDRPQGEPTRGALELGFYSGPLFTEPQDDALIVAVIGGSVAGLFAHDHWPERAFAGLAAGRRVEVLNLGLGGYKQPQSLLAFVYLLSVGVHLDAVLLLDGFNDVTLAAVENVPHGISPLYPRSWGQLLADLDATPEARALVAQIALLADWRRTLSVRLERSLVRVSRTAQLCVRLADRALAGMLARRRLALAATRLETRRDYLVTGPRWPVPRGEAFYAELAAIWERGSLQMARLASANGIRFVHVLQPNQYGSPKPMGEAERRLALNEAHPYARHARAGYPHLRAAGEALRAAGVEFHDLSGLFAEVAEAVYIDDCCHLNPRGNALLAEAIAARLE